MSNGQQTTKKGLSPLAWVAIGCAGLLVIGAVVAAVVGIFVVNKVKDVAADFEANPAKAAAEMMVRLNPDIELVSSDDDAGTMTIRDKQSGEETTLDFDDIAEGRFSFETAEGRVEFDAGDVDRQGIRISSDQGEALIGAGAAAELPDWVPRYPGSTPEAAFTSSGSEGQSGLVSYSTSDQPAKVLDFFNRSLKGAGYDVTRQEFSSSAPDATFAGAVTGVHEADGREITVTVTRQDDTTTAALQYSGNN